MHFLPSAPTFHKRCITFHICSFYFAGSLHSLKNCLTSYSVCLHEKQVTDKVAPEASEARATYRASASLLKKLIRVAFKVLTCLSAAVSKVSTLSSSSLSRIQMGLGRPPPPPSPITLSPLLQQLSLTLPLIQHNFNRRTTFILSVVEVLEKKVSCAQPQLYDL